MTTIVHVSFFSVVAILFVPLLFFFLLENDPLLKNQVDKGGDLSGVRVVFIGRLAVIVLLLLLQ